MKKPKHTEFPKAQTKTPRGGSLASDISARNFRWRVDQADYGGQWGWRDVAIQTLFGSIIPKLHDFESMTWSAIAGSGSHFVAIEDLCTEAQTRLRELERDEQDQLFSLRLDGRMRIWGVRDVGIFRMLWCDPEHTVCPSDLRHT